MELIPIPILFNPLKHHLGYISSFIRNYSSDINKLNSDLLIIGRSQTDLYLGSLSFQDVSEQILSCINNRLLDNKHNYIKYIHECNDFDTIELNDQSKWILRVGHHPTRFIHIHPARGTHHVLRLKANILKSIIAIKIVWKQEIGLDEINQVRTEILELAPLNPLKIPTGIVRNLDLFNETTGQ